MRRLYLEYKLSGRFGTLMVRPGLTQEGWVSVNQGGPGVNREVLVRTLSTVLSKNFVLESCGESLNINGRYDVN